MKKGKGTGQKNIYLLGSSSLLNDAGSEMLVPILPFYISALGGNGAVIGLLSGLRTGIPGIFKIVGGWLSDRLGRRMPFVQLGYTLSVIFKFILALATSWQQIITALSFERAGKIRDAPRDAIIADSMKKRGKAFSIHQAFDNIGGILGSLLIILLFWILGFNMKSIILVAASITFLSLIPLIFVKEPRFKKIRKSLFDGIANLNKKVKAFILVATIFAFADFGLYMFMIMRAKEITGSIIIPMVLYVLFNSVAAGLIIPFGNLADRIGKKKLIIFGYLLFVVTAISFAFVSSILPLVFLFIFYGLVYALIQSNQRAYVADLSDKENNKGTALGLFHTATGIVAIPAGLIAGIVWDISPAVMFVYSAAIALFSLILLASMKEK